MEPSEGVTVAARDWRALGKPHNSIHYFLSKYGGIVPPALRRSLLMLTAVEREDISRWLASGSSIRDIAKGLRRAASTVSREVHAMAAVLSRCLTSPTSVGERATLLDAMHESRVSRVRSGREQLADAAGQRKLARGIDWALSPRHESGFG